MKNVLIVDDAAFMRMSLRLMLEKNGYNVIGEAVNGFDGIRKFKELRPDIVTMDVTMPEMDGLQALREIKKISADANVIMITAIGQESAIREAVMSGAKGFVVKPFKEGAIISAISKVAQ